jgi:pimeloyl-ACP methyl ester carboxylesterase
VRQITVGTGSARLSGLISEPSRIPPRAVVVALHGGGMRAGYFDGQALAGMSLLELGAGLGYTVLALDRPGYGLSADRFPAGRTLAEQTEILRAVLADAAGRYEVGAGFFLVAHSYGGKLALTTAAETGTELIGVDVSGCGHRYAADTRLLGSHGRAGWRLNWGPLGLYPPDTFTAGRALVTPMPERERQEALRWPESLPGVAARIRIPVRLTFAEHEAWWRHDQDSLAELTTLFGSALVTVDRQPDAGHNISLGWAARSYHLRALGFLEQCLYRREAAHPRPRTVPTPA